jgi:ABC-type multidrug transport system permease subunit
MTMNVSFNAIQNVILIFPDERPVFLREVNNNMYKVGPYFWAKVFSELPFSIMTPSIFGVIVYWTVALNPEIEKFFMFLLTLILIYNASSGYSLIISASFSDKQLAVTLTPVLIIPFMLFAGFFVSTSSIPIFLKEFEYLSIFKYGYQALMMNEFSGNPNFPCSNGVAPNGDAYTDDYSYCAGTNPLSQISNETLLSSLCALGALYVGCYLISWLLLAKLSKSFD